MKFRLVRVLTPHEGHTNPAPITATVGFSDLVSNMLQCEEKRKKEEMQR